MAEVKLGWGGGGGGGGGRERERKKEEMGGWEGNCHIFVGPYIRGLSVPSPDGPLIYTEAIKELAIISHPSDALMAGFLLRTEYVSAVTRSICHVKTD